MFKSAKFVFLLICVLCAVERCNSFAFTARTTQLRSTRSVVNRNLSNSLVMKAESPRPFSSSDWFENLKNLPSSRVTKDIFSHLMFNTAWAVAVTAFHMFTPQHYIDDFHISTVPHSIMAGSLALLLVFRTNASYDRFWEARKIWGYVTNVTRNLTRLAKANFEDEEVLYFFKEYLKAFPFLLKQHLQDVRNDDELEWLKEKFSNEEFENIQSHPNPPVFVCSRMSEILKTQYSPDTEQIQTSVFYRIKIEEGINLLIDYMGMCERILTTPVPRSYSRHTSRFLTMFLFTLPIVLVPHTEFGTPFVVFLVGWGLLSIEGIAYLIEQPFHPVKNQLPMINYCLEMQRDLEKIATESTYENICEYMPELKKYEREERNNSKEIGYPFTTKRA
mmetsp:Transcript_14872/g.22138  ORF Transcript_14872/g.22138 Transcript_14872/m.22138 type:complete len:390 (-) Transcript_14872:53-1222(-)